MLLLTRSRVTYIKFIHLKLITVMGELKYYYNIEDIKQQGITVMEGECGCQNRRIFCVTMLVFHWLFYSGVIIGSCKTLCGS